MAVTAAWPEHIIILLLGPMWSERFQHIASTSLQLLALSLRGLLCL